MSTLHFIYSIIFFGGLSALAVAMSVPIAVIPLAAMFSVVAWRFIKQKLKLCRK